MKLKTEFQDKNFRKGEVADVSIATMPDGRIVARAKAKSGGEYTFYYNCIEALCNDWSDYEEPKERWYINENGGVMKYVPFDPDGEDLSYMKYQNEIGNYFETKEEAELAVRKLKAWKRLKDKGFRFTGINDDEDSQELITQCGILCEADIYHLEKDADFLLIFGGEE